MSTIVLRSVKGTPLTNQEVDDNFNNLNVDKTQIGGTYSSGTANSVLYLSASKVLTSGSALTFDGTVLTSTTIDATNLEVTNIKAKDGTASISLADTTGIATFSKATVVQTTDNTNAALRITQLGIGNALVVEDSTNPDSTPFVIDASGKTLIARSTASAGADGALQINVQGASLPAVMTNTSSTSYRPHWMMAVNDVEVAAIGTTNTALSTYMGGVIRTNLSSLGTYTLSPTTGAGAGITVNATNLSGATTNIGIHSNVTFGSAATVRGEGFQTTLATEAAAFTLAELGHFKATQGTIGAGSTVTNQYGFNADSTLIGATNNYGFFSELTSGTGRWNFYASGTAENFFGGNTVISVTDNTNAALRITQLGTGNALVVEDSTNPDSTPVVVDNNGNILQGTTTLLFDGGASVAKIQSVSAGNNNSRIRSIQHYGNSFGPQINFANAASTTIGDFTSVVTSDTTLGSTWFYGSDGTTLIQGAFIGAQVDGTAGANDMPGRLVFSTTADGASTVTERTRIDSAGRLRQFGTTIISNVDVLNATYDSVSFSVAAEETAPSGLFFSPDGSKMFVMGTNGDDVNEYVLSTPWVVSSATYSTVFSVQVQDTGPTGLFFRADGLKMYVVGQTNDTVFQYALTSPWSVATASYESISFSVAAQELISSGIFFKPDGLSMYIIGSTSDGVYQYTLSTAWNVSTATYLQTFSVSGQDTAPQDLSFTGDGTRMFMLGSTGDDVNVYNLTTPWDISTATSVGAFSVAGQENVPTGLFIKPDGTKMYIAGQTNDTVYQYTVPSVEIQLTGTTAINGSATVAQDLTVNGDFNTSGSIASTSASSNSFAGQVQLGAGTAAAPALSTTGDTNTGIFFPAADTISFAEGGAEAMRIDSSGNVGIGTSSPGSKLAVLGSDGTGFTGVTSTNSNTNVGIAGVQFSSDPTYVKAAIGLLRSNVNGVGSLVFYNDSNTDAANWSTGDEKMRIDSSGTLLVGTTSTVSGCKLNVAGGINSTNGALNVSGNGGFYNAASKFGVDNNAGASRMYSSGANSSTRGSYEFHITDSVGTLDTVAMTLDSSGNLLVGTTSTTVNPGVVIEPTGRINIGRSNNDNVAEFYRSGTRVGSIGVTTTNTSFNTSSDYRLKEAIAPMTGALAKVAALKPCTYKWKVDGSDGQGFIAHELDEVVKGCVTGAKDAVQEEQYEVTPAVKDEEGNIVTEAVMGTRIAPVYQGIDTSFLVATLTAAIQEQQALITALTTRITALEST